MIKELEELWWSQWMRQVFPSLVPFRKWKVEHRNPCVGDVVLVQYSSKVGKGDFRMARVSEVHPDSHGVVRTITVKMRPRDAREKVLDNPPFLAPKPPLLLRLGVQRVCVLLPVEEQGDSSTAGPATTSTLVQSESTGEETTEEPADEPAAEPADIEAEALGDDEHATCSDKPPGALASALRDDEDFLGFTSEEAERAQKYRRPLQNLMNIC